jgi:hypothetical protein
VSLAINMEDVKSVKIGDEWIECVLGSFWIDSYEFYHVDPDFPEDHELTHWVTFPKESGTPYVGFRFVPEDDKLVNVCGPVTAIQALREEIPLRVGKRPPELEESK